MTLAQINFLNIGLMLISCAVAYTFPFDLIVYSYAFLGPAHYLTQISWLHNRNYFTTGGKDYWILVLLTGPIAYGYNGWGALLIWYALSAAFAMTFFKEQYVKAALFLGLGSLAIFLDSGKTGSVLWIFVPTLIHVYFFTGCFILIGALRGREYTGVLSFVVFVLCGLSFFIYFPDLVMNLV